MRIQANHFGPMLAAGHQHKYILCITDAFTKYAFALENKETETVTKAICTEWFCKFGIPAQIDTDGRKEFVNKLSNKLFTLYLMFSILRQLCPTLRVMPKWTCSTKLFRSI
jgi:hypothetical protein